MEGGTKRDTLFKRHPVLFISALVLAWALFICQRVFVQGDNLREALLSLVAFLLLLIPMFLIMGLIARHVRRSQARQKRR